MTSKSLSQPRFKQLKTLRAIAIGLTISFAAPAFADNLPDAQRLIKQGQYPQALEKVDAYLRNKPKNNTTKRVPHSKWPYGHIRPTQLLTKL